jgi:large subunit ribosomal protein L20
MARVKRGTKRRARRKKYLKRTKGFFLTKSKLYQSAQEAANRADRYAFRDRRVKKRQYRQLWIQRIGAAARLNGITYGQLIHGLKAAGVDLDRKVLADIAVKDAAAFASLAATCQDRRTAASEKEEERGTVIVLGANVGARLSASLPSQRAGLADAARNCWLSV